LRFFDPVSPLSFPSNCFNNSVWASICCIIILFGFVEMADGNIEFVHCRAGNPVPFA
jgi:hypothetical protein